MRKVTVAVLACVACLAVSFPAQAQGQAPPPGWGQRAPLPPANGIGQVTFTQGGTAYTLPLNKIEIDTSIADMFMVTLNYVDAAQENKLDLTFGSMPKLGKSDPHPITGFIVQTKSHGLSRSAGNRTKCDLVITSVSAQGASGTISCKSMMDMSAENAAPDVTDVKFEGRRGAK